MAKKRGKDTGEKPEPKPAAATPATEVLSQAGVPYALHTYRHDPRAEEYGMEAAQELGVDPRRVFKTLLARVDGEPVVAVVPVSGKLRLKALAATVGGKKATLATTEDAERLTGYQIGGISPFGQRRKLPTIVDESAMSYGSILVSAGRRGLDLEIMPDLLLNTLHARTAPIGRPS